MKNIYKYILGIMLIIIVISFLFLVFNVFSDETVSDSTNDLNVSNNLSQAIATGEKLNKSIVIYFTSDSCYYCTEFEEKTLENKEVISKLNENYIFVSVNIKNEPDIAREFQVYSTPTTIFMDNNGNEYVKLIGYQSSEDFLNYL